MKRFIFSKKNKTRAQAMVEFMLALPILLIILYGLIEVGRLAFIFSSTANASRQAARYGAASGEINDVAFYQDCEGIRSVAEESAFIIEFENINITYDRGVDEDGNQVPISGVDPSPDEDTCPIPPGVIRNGDRIIVQVSAIYEPIISGPVEPMEIVSSSARSFLISVPIVGSALPTGFSPETSTPSQVPTSSLFTSTPTLYVSPTYTFIPPSLLTNTPNPNFTPTLTREPTLTFTPSRTPLPTYTPSVTPTAISCNGITGVTHGPLEFKDNVMKMSIDNQTGHTLVAANIYLEWNHDTGHGEGNDLGLILNRVTFAGQAWDGALQAPSAYIPAFYPTIPPGISTISFSFHQNYLLTDGTERIIVNIGTPGCINYPVDSSH
ncbi:MAG TPA: TadE/TadG family type IV pilus assembly protein [Anaerolineales bacterium]|nr:TadE/TadG family type IV pilus assembly protein [Anaerolineales bacterium]